MNKSLHVIVNPEKTSVYSRIESEADRSVAGSELWSKEGPSEVIIPDLVHRLKRLTGYENYSLTIDNGVEKIYATLDGVITAIELIP